MATILVQAASRTLRDAHTSVGNCFTLLESGLSY